MRYHRAFVLACSWLLGISAAAAVAPSRSASSCSRVTTSVSPSKVDMSDRDKRDGCEVTVTWEASAAPPQDNTAEVVDVFIVVDESESVGKRNYDNMIVFVKDFIQDLDQSASLFRNGGRVGITEFSWSPTNMKAFTSRKECEKENKGLPCFDQKLGRDSKDYLIPTSKYAEPNSYHIAATLSDALEAAGSEDYEPTSHKGTESDPQWPAYGGRCLGDAIKFTAEKARLEKEDGRRRGSTPNRQIMFVVTAGNSNRGHYSAFDAANAARGYGIDVYAVGIGKSVDPSQQQDIGGPHTGKDDDNIYVLSLDDFTGLDDNFSMKIVNRVIAPCATHVLIEVVTAAGVGEAPTSVLCNGRGDKCEVDGYTMTWSIAALDRSKHIMSYSIDVCSCDNVGGTVETLARSSYSDDGNSPYAFPAMPLKIPVELSDSSYRCGAPSVGLGVMGEREDVRKGNKPARVGDCVRLTFEISNERNNPLQHFCLTDSNLGDGCLECAEESGATSAIIPGGTFVCHVDYKVKQRDVDRGEVKCSAKMTARYSDGETIEKAADTAVALPGLADLTVVNTGVWTENNPSNVRRAGDEIVYTIVTTNSGTVTLEGLEVTDSSGEVSCNRGQPLASLDVEDSHTCRVSHKIFQSEVNAGIASNTAIVTAVSKTGESITRTHTWTGSIGHDLGVELATRGAWIDQEGGGTVGYADMNEVIEYTFTVRNTGNVDLKAVSVSNPGIVDDCSTLGKLGAGSQVSCEGSYSLTWTEINAGVMKSTGTVTATGPGALGTVTRSNTEEVHLKPPPSITLGVTGLFVDNPESGDNLASAGEFIVYTAIVTNSGHARLFDVRVSDPSLVSGSRGSSSFECDEAYLRAGGKLSLAVGDRVECTITYAISSGDIANREKKSRTTVTAVDLFDNRVEATDMTSVLLEQVGAVQVKLTDTYIREGPHTAAATPGDKVDYAYTITNSGLLPLYDISIEADALARNGAPIECVDTNGRLIGGSNAGSVVGLALYPSEGLAPAAFITCTATSRVSQKEINAGVKKDRVKAFAFYETSAGTLGQDAIESASALSTAPLLQVPSIVIENKPRYKLSGLARVGEFITFEASATNKGNVDVEDVAISNELFKSTGSASGGWDCGSGGVPSRLRVGASFDCSGTYILTQSDIDAGFVNDTASLVGRPVSGGFIKNISMAAQSLERTGSLSAKAACTASDSDGIAGDSAGDSIEYTIDLENTGTTTLTAVDVSSAALRHQLDSGHSDAKVICTPRLENLALAPRDTTTCSAVYEVQQGDIDRGRATITATASASSPIKPVHEEVHASSDFSRDRTVQVVTTGAIDKGSDGAVGEEDELTLTVEIANSGNTCLTDVRVSDARNSPMVCKPAYTVFCPHDVAMKCSGTYTINQADVDNGEWRKTVEIESLSSSRGARDVVGREDFTQTLVGTAIMTIEVGGEWKDGSRITDPAHAGKPLTRTYTVTNRGTTTLFEPCVIDPKLDVGCLECNIPDDARILPGKTFECEHTSKVSQAEIDEGAASMDAFVNATDSLGRRIGAEAMGSTRINCKHAISLERDSEYTGDDDEARVGDIVTHTYDVLNSGSATITHLKLTGTKDEVRCTPNLGGLKLAPGAAVSCQSKSGYAISQDDIDAGFVFSTATITGSSSHGSRTVKAAANQETFLSRISRIVVEISLRSVTTKNGIHRDYSDAGDTAFFNITIRNIGNTRLSEVVLLDDVFGNTIACNHELSIVASRFAPSERSGGVPIVCDASKVLSVRDVDAGVITGTAEVTYLDPLGKRDRAKATCKDELDRLALITVAGEPETEKWTDENGNERVDNGESVSFSGTVTNRGTITLESLDATGNDVTCDIPASGRLGQGETFQCHSSSQVTQGEINAGKATRTMTASAVAVDGTEVVSAPLKTDIALSRKASIGLEMTARWKDDPNLVDGTVGYADSAEIVLFSIKVTNTGNVDLRDATVFSADIAHVGCEKREKLDVGKSFTCTGTRRISWDDVTRGMVDVLATAKARDPLSGRVSTAESTSTPLKKPPSIGLGVDRLFGDGALPADGKARPGDTITYELTVTNDGYATLYDTTLSDPSLLTETGISTILCATKFELRGKSVILTDPFVAGATVVCTGKYTLMAGDVENLRRENHVTVEAKDEYGHLVKRAVTKIVPLDQAGSIRMNVTHEYKPTPKGGEASTTDTVTYNYEIVNNGVLSLYGLALRDSVLQAHGAIITCKNADGTTWVGSEAGVADNLAPNADKGFPPLGWLVCTGSDKVTQKEINAGKKETSPVVEAYHQGGSGKIESRVSDSSTSTVALKQAPKFVVKKKADYTPSDKYYIHAEVGEAVQYFIAATNTGNVDITGSVITDAMFDLAEGGFNKHCVRGVPDPWGVNVKVSCKATYILTQEDIDAGVVENIVRVMGESPSGQPVADTAEATVQLVTTQKLSIFARETLVDSDSITGVSAGDTVEYELTIGNAGTTRLSNVRVTSSLLDQRIENGYSGPGWVCKPNLGLPQLDPGATIDCKMSAKVSQYDINRGGIGNDVEAAATGPRRRVSKSHNFWQILARDSSIGIVVTANLQHGEKIALKAKETVKYTIEIANTGNTCLRDIALDKSAFTCDVKTTELCPQDATVECTGEYVIKQNDMDKGGINGKGTVRCLDPEGSPVVAEGELKLALAGTASVSLDVGGSWRDRGEDTALVGVGESISLVCTVTNEGTTALMGSCLTSDYFGVDLCHECPRADKLAPGQSFKCTIYIEVLQEDVDVGYIETTIGVLSVDARGNNDYASSPTRVKFPSTGKLLLEADGSLDGKQDDVKFGDSISYTFFISNEGLTTLSDLVLKDSMVPVVCSPDLNGLKLGPKKTVECKSSSRYMITQEDINAGSVTNTATSEGWSPPPGRVKVVDQDGDIVDLRRKMETSVSRTLDSISKYRGLSKIFVDEGDIATFKVTIKNTGNTALDTVFLTDTVADAGSIDCDQDFAAANSEFLPDSHPSGDAIVCTVETLLTGSHIDAGGFKGTSKVAALGPDKRPVRSEETTRTVVAQQVALRVEISGSWADGDDNGRRDVGENISFDVDIANKGTVTLQVLKIMDDSSGSATCTRSESLLLRQEERHKCTGRRQVTQEDLNDGSISYTVSATGLAVNDEAVDESYTWTDDLEQEAAVSLVVTGDWKDSGTSGVADYADEDELVVYSVTVRNTGNVDLSDVGVVHARISSDCRVVATLGPGDSFKCDGTYALSWPDIGSGVLDLPINVEGHAPWGGAVSDVTRAPVTLKAPPSIALETRGLFLDNFSPSDGKADAGETIKFTMTVTNNGRAPLSSVAVSDPSAISDDGTSTIVCREAFVVFGDATHLTQDLGLGKEMSCSYSYVLTADDVISLERGAVGKVTASDPYGHPVEASDSKTVSLSQVGSVQVLLEPFYAKFGTRAASSAAFDKIQYTITITNSGMLKLYDIGIEDEDLRARGVRISCTDVDLQTATGAGHGVFAGLAAYPEKGLAPAASLSCTAEGGVTQAEINAGEKMANLRVQAWYESRAGTLDREVFSAASRTVDLIPSPGCDVQVTANHKLAEGANGLASIGDTIAYTVKSKNNGNVDMTGVAITDSIGSQYTGCLNKVSNPWLVGGKFACTPEYMIRQADIDAGEVINTISVTGHAASGGMVTDTASATQALVSRSELSVTVRTVLVESDSVEGVSAGDVLRYEIELRNAGGTTLYQIAVSDPLLNAQNEGGFGIAKVICIPSLSGLRLAPGRTVPCKATYTVTQTDVNDGSITSTLTAVGESHASPVTAEFKVSETLAPFSSIQLVATKTDVDKREDGILNTGDTIEYRLRVANSGITCLTDVVLRDKDNGIIPCDDSYTGSARLEDMFCPQDQPFTCTGMSTIDQDDINAGSRVITSYVSTVSPNRDEILDTTDTIVRLHGAAGITVELTADYTPSGGYGAASSVGDAIAYTLTINNHGALTLLAVTFWDSKVKSLSCEPDLSGAKLDAGDEAVCVGSYIMVQGDIDAGKVINAANVTAVSTSGESVFDNTRHTQKLVQDPSIFVMLWSVHMMVSSDGKARKGDTISYAAEVQNLGNTCLTDIVIDEMLVDEELDCKKGFPHMLCPADKAIYCTGTYILTQGNVDAASISNTATVIATTPGNGGAKNTIVSEDSDSQSWKLYPDISLDASVSLVSGGDLPYAGDQLAFGFEVENGGTSSLVGISLTVPLLEKAGTALHCTPSLSDALVLAPEDTILCSATLELTQDDIEGALLGSTAFARGEAGDGQAVLAEKYVEKDLNQRVGLSLVEAGVFTDENLNARADEGETIRYTTTMRNTGNVRVEIASVSHSLEEDVMTCNNNSLAESWSHNAELMPREKIICAATHFLSQEEVDTGTIVNTASATGAARDKDGTEIDTEDVSELVLPQEAEITLSIVGIFADDGTVNRAVDAGDHMEYAFTVGNSGSTTLTQIVVHGPILDEGAVSCPNDWLAPAELMVCTASYTITADNVASHLVEADVTVTASGPTGQTPRAEKSNRQRLDAQPSLSLVEGGVHVDSQFEADSASSPGTNGNHRANAGEYIRYSMVVRNTGLVTVHAIDVVETLLGVDVTCPENYLEVAESMVCSATYLFTQDDLDKGGVRTLTTVTGYDRNVVENRATIEAEATSWVELPQDASVAITQECAWHDGVEGDDLPDAGESMLLTYTISNTGSVTLLSGTLQESHGDGSAIDCRRIDTSGDSNVNTGPLDSISPDDEVVCTSYKAITQADIDAGSASSNAAFTAFSPLDASLESAADCSWTWGIMSPQINTAVTGRFVDENGDKNSAAGETVTFNISITNDGKITTTVVDVLATPATSGLSGFSSTGATATVVCDAPLASSPSVAPGETLACIAGYAIKQDNINFGEIGFDFETTVADPAGVETTFSDTSSVKLPSKHRISLVLEGDDEASVDVDRDGKSSAGDKVVLPLTVSNSGSVDLTDVEVQDAALEGLVCQRFLPAAVGQRRRDWGETNTDEETFAPNDSYKCEGVYTLTQNDVDSGQLHNTASVTSTSKDRYATPVMAGAEETMLLESHPSIAVVIVGQLSDLDFDNLADEGEQVVFDITVNNTGNVRMGQIQVLGGLLQDVTCIDKPVLLEPQGYFSCSGYSTLTQEDINHGVVTLEVEVTAADPSSVLLSVSDVDSVRLARNLELGLHKNASYMESLHGTDTIDYSFEVTNRGTTTLRNLSVIDASLAGDILCPNDTLAPGGLMACNSSEPRGVTTKDLIIGSIVNTATVVGKGPRDDDPTVTATDKVVTLTPSGGDDPVVLSYTSISLLPATVSRRRLEETGDDQCGVDAIVAACKQAFGVTACQCVQHSDGGCDGSSSSSSSFSSGTIPKTTHDGVDIAVGEVEKAEAIFEAAGESNLRSSAAGDAAVVEEAQTTSGEAASQGGSYSLSSEEGDSSGLHATASSSAELSTTGVGVGVDGGWFGETEQEVVTTELEIRFTTDAESTGAMKAAAAIDSFANVTHGFKSLLIGNCFEDVIITAVTISQADTQRVPNRDASSASYSDQMVGRLTSVIGFDADDSNPFEWIMTFILATVLVTGMCVCLGVACVRRSTTTSPALAKTTRRKITENKVRHGGINDSAALGTPEASQYEKQNRMFSTPATTSDPRRGSRLSAAQTRAALNARSNPFFRTRPVESNEGFAVLTSGSDFTSVSEQKKEAEEEEEREVHTANPIFEEPGGRGHMPPLSALDFGRTIDDADGEGDPVPEFWRRGGGDLT